MASRTIRTIKLASGDEIPVMGQGTWEMGENAEQRKNEIAALQLGIDLDMTVIDTAEMYGDGAAEELVGEAITGRRDEVFLVSKVLPSNATRRGTIAACERSMRRLKTDRIDLYLLHWRGQVPLEETIEAFSELVDAGKIKWWGVSNFNVASMKELVDLPNGAGVTANQVLYNLTRRGIEYDLVPWCYQYHLPIMAYSPIEQGRLLNQPELRKVAARHGTTAAQIALAWVLRREHLIAIPKAATLEHVKENRAALDLHLTEQDIAMLDRAFPAPTRARPLEML